MAWRDKAGHIWTATDIGGDWATVERFRGPLVEVSPSASTPPAQRLRDIAGALVHEAAIAARPGQLDRLEAMAADLRLIAGTIEDREQDQIETWERSDG